MKLTGVLVWYDESPSQIGAAVAGMARICDTIVAVDGAYYLYPGGRPRSMPDQSEVILNTCEAMSVGCIIHRPRDVWWGCEVEKRNHSLQLARTTFDPAPVDGPPTDQWVLIFDADYQVMLLEDPAFTRKLISDSDKHVVRYTLFESKDLMADEWMANYAQQRPVDTEWGLQDRGIFRWTDDLRYEMAHYVVRGTYEGELLWLRGPDLAPGQAHHAAPTDDLGRNLVVAHRNKERPLSRRHAADGYYELRKVNEVEPISPTALVIEEVAA